MRLKEKKFCLLSKFLLMQINTNENLTYNQNMKLENVILNKKEPTSRKALAANLPFKYSTVIH